MSETITTEYKERKITYNDSDSTWNTVINGVELSAPTLALLRPKMDKVLKGNFKRIPALYLSGWSHSDKQFVDCIVTSISKERHYNYAWILQGKSRSKEGLDSIYADTPANRKIAAQYIVTQKEIKELEKKANKLLESMAGIDVKGLTDVNS